MFLLPKTSSLCVAAAVAVCLSFTPTADAAKRLRPITKPKFDPKAERVELFEGMENGNLSVQVIPQNAEGGNILIENKTKKPLTVELPKAFVGVHVLKQAMPGGAGGLGDLGAGGDTTGQQGGGQQQPFGGGMGMMGGMGGMGMGGMGMGGMGMGGMGGGFFSVPPERVVLMKYHSVCLAHGKPDPSPKATYKLVKVEDYTKDESLQKLIQLIGMNKINQKAAQAAAWHLTDNMSWRELATKSRSQLGGRPPIRYFHPAHLVAAQQLVATAAKKDDDKKPTTPRTGNPRVRQTLSR